MAVNVEETFELLFDKKNTVAYRALQDLQRKSEETDCVYAYMDRLSDMLENDNSYIRTRGLTLIAYNARWDRDNKIDEIIDGYLKHITDVKQGRMTDYGRKKIEDAKKNGQWDAVNPLAVITEEQIARLSAILESYEPAYTNFQVMSLSVKKTYTRAIVFKKVEKNFVLYLTRAEPMNL